MNSLCFCRKFLSKWSVVTGSCVNGCICCFVSESLVKIFSCDASWTHFCNMCYHKSSSVTPALTPVPSAEMKPPYLSCRGQEASGVWRPSQTNDCGRGREAESQVSRLRVSSSEDPVDEGQEGPDVGRQYQDQLLWRDGLSGDQFGIQTWRRRLPLQGHQQRWQRVLQSQSHHQR